jgi:hypothetical protein
MQGRIDISFWVKGRRGVGKVKFVSMRKRGNQFVSAVVVTRGKTGLTDKAVANAFT